MPEAQVYFAEEDLVAVDELGAIVGHALVADPGAAGALLVIKPVYLPVPGDRRVQPRYGQVLGQGDVGQVRRAAEPRFFLVDGNWRSDWRLGSDDLKVGHAARSCCGPVGRCLFLVIVT